MDTVNFRGWYCNTGYATLTQEERHHNGMRLAQSLYNFGWTEEAIAGILGNVEPESGTSPAALEQNIFPDYIPSNQDLIDAHYDSGLGWLQWSPGDEFFQWVLDNNLIWYDGMTQVKRFKWEYDTLHWPWWPWYAHVTSPPEDCGEFFCRRYCAPVNPDATVGNRRAAALRWYNEIHDKLHRPIDWWIYSRKGRERKELKRRCLRM